eukprot:1047477-Karenia_brevis.AAC.1
MRGRRTFRNISRITSPHLKLALALCHLRNVPRAPHEQSPSGQLPHLHRCRRTQDDRIRAGQ